MNDVLLVATRVYLYAPFVSFSFFISFSICLLWLTDTNTTLTVCKLCYFLSPYPVIAIQHLHRVQFVPVWIPNCSLYQEICWNAFVIACRRYSSNGREKKIVFSKTQSQVDFIYFNESVLLCDVYVFVLVLVNVALRKQANAKKSNDLSASSNDSIRFHPFLR